MKSEKKLVAQLVGIAFELVGIIAVMAYLGTYLDKTYELEGMGIAASIMTGMTVWIIHIIWIFRKYS